MTQTPRCSSRGHRCAAAQCLSWRPAWMTWRGSVRRITLMMVGVEAHRAGGAGGGWVAGAAGRQPREWRLNHQAIGSACHVRIPVHAHPQPNSNSSPLQQETCAASSAALVSLGPFTLSYGQPGYHSRLHCADTILLGLPLLTIHQCACAAVHCRLPLKAEQPHAVAEEAR